MPGLLGAVHQTGRSGAAMSEHDAIGAFDDCARAGATAVDADQIVVSGIQVVLPCFTTGCAWYVAIWNYSRGLCAPVVQMHWTGACLSVWPASARQNFSRSNFNFGKNCIAPMPSGTAAN